MAHEKGLEKVSINVSFPFPWSMMCVGESISPSTVNLLRLCAMKARPSVERS
jgi:hypothetical protein